ncbi:MAG TPA: penicillin-binding transpeptidase domain-containing protein [Kofleriaceae bacterium]|nr:penicillin-binding transpeptidase domain-containing protein [Kofleriaceae bacterium]
MLLGVGSALAAALLLFGRGDPATRVAHNVGSSPLPGAGSATATPPAAPAADSSTDGALLPPPRLSTAFAADRPRAATAGSPTLDLARVQRVGDRFHAPLSDGRTAVLTLDPALQEAAELTLTRAKAPRGAIVVTDRDGRILALAGRRTDDPKGGKEGIWDATVALDAWAPAASIFKVVSAAAMVEAGAHGDDKVCFHGGVRSVMESNLVDGKLDRRCEDLSYGLAHSQNAIIAKMAHRHLDPKKLGDAAHRFGFGKPMPFPAPAVYGTATMPADKGVEFARTAAGFSGVELSALGGAVLAGTIASGGQAPTPTIIAAVIDRGREQAWPAAAPARRVLDPRVAAEVAAMMTETCAKGSAAKAFNGRERLGDIKVAGKTGTLSRHGEPFYLQYSWFVGFAPADRPLLNVSVVLGNAELWYMKAHTAARAVLGTGLRLPDATRSARRGR